MEKQDSVDSISASWMIYPNSKEFEKKLFEKDIAEFLKTSVNLIKD